MDKVSYFVVDNLHCPSCVFTVKATLSDNLNIPATNVHISLVSQTITVRHSEQITRSAIYHALENVGFEVEIEGDDRGHRRSGMIPWISDPLSKRRRNQRHRKNCKLCQADHRAKQEKKTLTSKSWSIRSTKSTEKIRIDQLPASASVDFRSEFVISGMTCASCANGIMEGMKANRVKGVLSCDVNLMTNSATVVHDRSKITAEEVGQLIEDLGFKAEVVSTRPISRRPRVASYEGSTDYRLEFHIGGMSCASCSNAITHGLKDEPYIKSVNINLMANSGTAILGEKEDASRVKDAIELIGFSCDLGEIAPLRPLEATPANDVRVVRIRIDGMLCSQSTVLVAEAMESVPGVIDFTAVTIDDPVIVVRYKPSPPEVTLRTIFAAVKAINLTPSIEKNPSIEERSQRLQAREQRNILWRIIAAGIIAIPTFVIGIVYMSLVPHDSPGRIYWETEVWGKAARDVVALFFLATPVQFFIANHFHRRALHGLYSLWGKGSRIPIWKRFVRFGSMDLLICLGTSVAYFASVILLIMSATAKGSSQSYTTTFFDTTVFLTLFILLGRYLEAYTKHKAADAVGMLSNLRPTEAILDNIGDDERVSSDLLEVGDIVKVPNGSSPPGDGVIISGSSKFDESSLTGESRHVPKQVGDLVYVGTVNVGSVITVKLEAIGGTSMLDKIVNIVRQGQSNRAPIERLADTLTGYFVPVIVLFAILTWIIWLSLGLSGSLPARYLDVQDGGWVVWSLQFAIAVFVVACPCGIGLAAPTACYVGSGLAAKFGILVQGGGEAFQEASMVDCVVFDKTGTLTQGGEPKVTDSEIFVEDRSEALAIARELESASTHTLAIAVREFCRSSGSESEIVTERMEEVGGRGIYAEMHVNGESISAIIGNESWLNEHGAIFPPNSTSLLDSWKSQGKSVVIVAVRSVASSEKTPELAFNVTAQFAVADPLREEAPVVIKELQNKGIATWMITGDNATTAKAVARLAGIPEDQVIAGVLPHQKAEMAQWLQRTCGKQRNTRHLFHRHPALPFEAPDSVKGGKRAIVAMVGDGINDAPALAVSDLGIAIGSGSDITLGSAKFILLSSNLLSILTLFDLSKTVFRRVKFNFFWAIVYNMIGVPIAAGVLYPIGFRVGSSVFPSSEALQAPQITQTGH